MRREFGAVFAAKRGRRRLAAAWAMPRRSAARESNRGPLRLAAGSTRHPSEQDVATRRLSSGCGRAPGMFQATRPGRRTRPSPARVCLIGTLVNLTRLGENHSIGPRRRLVYGLNGPPGKASQAPSAWAIAVGLSNLILPKAPDGRNGHRSSNCRRKLDAASGPAEGAGGERSRRLEVRSTCRGAGSRVWKLPRPDLRRVTRGDPSTYSTHRRRRRKAHRESSRVAEKGLDIRLSRKQECPETGLPIA
jgi:hypothetical protein